MMYFFYFFCYISDLFSRFFSYNILFPENSISSRDCEEMRELLFPNKEMTDFINLTINELELENYIVIHIRSGDNYLFGNKKTFNNTYFELLKLDVYDILVENKNKDVLLIGDNNEIKYLIREFFKNYKIKTYYKDITHLGEGVELERENIKNTLLDFYLMGNSISIYSFTSYPHGSGFSYWCSILYNINYKCKFININET